MLEAIRALVSFLKGRDAAQLAMLFAYLFAPAAVMATGLLGLAGRGLAVDLGRPVVISELRSEIDRNGLARQRHGVAVTVESSAPEFHLPLNGASGTVWTSLEPAQLRANVGRVLSDSDGLTSRNPFLGMSGPVTLIVDGEPSGRLDLPGRIDPVADWRLPSRQSLALVSSVLISCVFAFGMSVAMGLPAAGSEQRTAG
jgi:hypothetical protein